MISQSTRPNTLSMALAAILILAMGFGSTMGPARGETSSLSGEVTDGHARFTVITPTLLRLEFSRDGKFINDRTYFAWHRFGHAPAL